MLDHVPQAIDGVLATRHNVVSTGDPDGPVLLFAHGFGCDQDMWRDVVPAFVHDHRVVLFDHIGAGRSDSSGYDPVRYAGLEGYADDILGICAELDLTDVTLVAHSVSAMMAVIAAVEQPGRFRQLVLVAPSPYLLVDPVTGYDGGFSAEDLADVMSTLDSNYFTWAEAMAPAIMGVPDAPELGERLTGSFCRTDPEIAGQLIRTIFQSDCRPLLPRVSTPALVLQCQDDVMAPLGVGDHLHEHLAGSTLVRLEATGHCPHMSAPEETAAAIRRHLRTST